MAHEVTNDPALLGGVDSIYTNSGQVKTKSVNGSVVVTYNYDAAGRLIGKVFPDNTSATFLYDLSGNLKRRYTSRSGVREIDEVFVYDERNRLTSTTTWVDGAPYEVKYGYDAKGNVTEVGNGHLEMHQCGHEKVHHPGVS